MLKRWVAKEACYGSREALQLRAAIFLPPNMYHADEAPPSALKLANIVSSDVFSTILVVTHLLYPSCIA